MVLQFLVFACLKRERDTFWPKKSKHLLKKRKKPVVRPVTMETRCFHKKLEFQRYPPKDLCTARYEHKSSKKKFQTFQKPRKKSFLGPSWAKIGLRKLSQMFVRSGEIPSPGQTSIDKTNDCTMKSERGALVRGSDPSSGQSVNQTTGDRWRAPARRLIQTHLGVENRRQNFSIPLRWQKIGLFSGLGEERWTPRATFRPLDHGST